MQPPHQKGAADDTEKGLQDFVGQLDPGIGRRAVYIGPAQGVARHHDQGTGEQGSPQGQERPAPETVAVYIGNGHGLETMGCKGYEHGQGIKEEISQKGTDTANQEGTGGVQDQGRRHDDDIVQVEMAAGDRQTKGRKTDVHGH